MHDWNVINENSEDEITNESFARLTSSLQSVIFVNHKNKNKTIMKFSSLGQSNATAYIKVLSLKKLSLSLNISVPGTWISVPGTLTFIATDRNNQLSDYYLPAYTATLTFSKGWQSSPRGFDFRVKTLIIACLLHFEHVLTILTF